MHDNSIAFLGDVVLSGPVEIRAPLPPRFVLNLEAPITASRAHTPGKISLKMPPQPFGATFRVKPLAVNLANNHIFDYGAAGFEDTADYLASNSVPFFGAGTAQENFRNPTMLDVAETRVALLGYVNSSTEPVAAAGPYRCALLETETVMRDITAAHAAGAEFIVLNLHWGAEQVYLPKPFDVVVARRFLSAGADLVIGHHSHRIQPWEQVGSKAAFYGVGNAVFADIEVPPVESGGIPRRIVPGQNRPWNRRSLAVVADPATRDLLACELRFDGDGALEPTGRIVRPARHLGRFAYPFRYRLSHLAGRLAYASFPYVRRRQLPNLAHARAIYRILSGSLLGKSPN